MDQNPKQQLIDRLTTANNILVTVSSDPSVDQLAACIGLTLLLNKMNKHATAVFSGDVPSTLEFLQPEDTIEKNTDSLRDFIIALDKSKADKLRYKVEDRVVKIFITPYRTSLTADDLEFSQGDFNVDLVVGLGVKEQQDLDAAITAHGRILHDATVATVNTTPDGGLGSINWHDTGTSSLCELVMDLSRALGQNLLDPQVSTALLTGIVAETNRFSNDKTTPQTMSVSAELMAAGANQQLVATKLEGNSSLRVNHGEPDMGEDAVEAADDTRKTSDGTLEITHEKSEEVVEESVHEQEVAPELDVKEESAESSDSETTDAPDSPSALKIKGPRLITEPPTLGGTLTANSEPEGLDPSVDPLGGLSTTDQPILKHDEPPKADMASVTDLPKIDLPEPVVPAPLPGEPALTPPPLPPLNDDQTSDGTGSMSEPQEDNSGPTAADNDSSDNASPEPSDPGADVNAARDQVTQALNSSPPVPEPIQALNAQPIDLDTPTDNNSSNSFAPAHESTAFDPTAFNVMNDSPSPGFQPPAGPPAETPAPLNFGAQPSPLNSLPSLEPLTPPAPASSAPPLPTPNLTPFNSMTPPPAMPQNPSSDNSMAPPPVPPPIMPPAFGAASNDTGQQPPISPPAF